METYEKKDDTMLVINKTESVEVPIADLISERDSRMQRVAEVERNLAYEQELLNKVEEKLAEAEKLGITIEVQID